MHVKLGHLIFSILIISMMVMVVTKFLIGVSSKNEMTKPVVAEVVPVVKQPCSESLGQYLLKAREYLAKTDSCQNGYGCVEPAVSALAWMEYFKICAEYPSAQDLLRRISNQ